MAPPFRLLCSNPTRMAAAHQPLALLTSMLAALAHLAELPRALDVPMIRPVLERVGGYGLARPRALASSAPAFLRLDMANLEMGAWG